MTLKQVIADELASSLPSSCRNCGVDIQYEKFGNSTQEIYEAVKQYLTEELVEANLTDIEKIQSRPYQTGRELIIETLALVNKRILKLLEEE